MYRRVPACAACLIAATMLLAAGVCLDARGVPPGLVIRVYDVAGVDASLRSRSIATARTVLANAGIEADWRECVRGGPADRCAPSVTPSATTSATTSAKTATLLVRLVHGDDDGPRDEGVPMGYAVIEPASGAGSLATVFLARVEQVAHAAGGDYATLLGRAIAHEVGHLLLGTNAHASSGLMRAQWTQQEILRNRAEDWAFSWRDRDQLGLTGVRVADSASR